MIRSGLLHGAAFGTATDGDPRSDVSVRETWSTQLGVSRDWATINQVHGSSVAVATHAGPHGDADAIVTARPDLPIAVAVADCLPIAVAGSSTVAIIHAGWRGLVAGVIHETLATMRGLGDVPEAASIGPHIRSCCYAVGPEVISGLGGFASTTRAGELAADLEAAAIDQLGPIEIETLERCTRDDADLHSFRADGTAHRQVAVAWL